MIGGVSRDFRGFAAAVAGAAEICGADEEEEDDDDEDGDEAAGWAVAAGAAAEPVASDFVSEFACGFASEFACGFASEFACGFVSGLISDLASAAALAPSGLRVAISGGLGRGKGGSTVTLARLSGRATGGRGAIISPSSRGPPGP